MSGVNAGDRSRPHRCWRNRRAGAMLSALVPRVAQPGGHMGGVLDLFNVLYDPGAVFARVKEKPRFWGPFIGLAVLQIIIAFLMLPYTKAAMQAMSQAQAAAGAAAPDTSRFAIIGVVMAPIGLAIGLLITAAVLWILASMLAGEGSFKHMLSVATYVGITGVLMGLATVAVLMLSSVRIQTMADLRPGFGLDLLAPNAGGFVKTMLWMVNPFTLWGLVLTGLGVAATHNASKGTAFTIATISFVVGAVIVAGFSLLGGGGAG
jgi:hypothetical protein